MRYQRLASGFDTRVVSKAALKRLEIGIASEGTLVTLDDLRRTLEKLPSGKMPGIHHDVYAELLPPGEPDERAREACYNFAKTLGCRIENKLQEKTVWFVKDT
ncbi:MAG: hypothetical protein BGN84_11050 [Afipia sp. 62-7]|nr:MAG: hypothetical protein BGN84_11050 [Afipia sp. 62-7]